MKLHAINCHQHTETADFIGGLRPARGRQFKLEALDQRVGALEFKVCGVAPRVVGSSADEIRSRLDELARETLRTRDRILERHAPHA